MKFQLEVYQDMLRHTQQKFHTSSHSRPRLLTKTVRDEFNSIKYYTTAAAEIR